MARFPRTSAALALALGLGVALAAAPAPRFYADDPLAREPESRDASKAAPFDIGLLYEITYNLFVTQSRQPSNVRAKNANTIDEVPDSSWFTNRMLPRTIAAGDLLRGPNEGPPPNPQRWVISREKSAGASPGFTASDASGQTWFLSCDTPGWAEGASGATVVATKIFWALGYNQVETFVTRIDRSRLVIGDKATVKRPTGKRTPMRPDDVNAVLERCASNADGTYRVAAGRLLTGKVLGPFRYDGTRPDDPNDTVEHQHRRELRALRVFGVWTNLSDLKAGNTLDTLVEAGGKSVVRHYLQDVGSTFGIAPPQGPRDWDDGFEYFYEGDALLKRLVSFGFALSPWQTAHYTEYRSVGRFESQTFDPRTWKPHTPTLAYLEMQPDDAFWAARRVAAFDDDTIRALVHTGEFSDPKAEAHLATILMQRRDKIARAYLPAVNPIVDARLDASAELYFENAAVRANVAQAPSEYLTTWFRFDNLTGETQRIGEARAAGTALKAPGALPSSPGDFVQIDVAAGAAAPAAWQKPVHLFFRRSGAGWTLTGVDRGGR
ncbi:MAG TPA: hypothetical protein VGI12_06115 [Vicinamibacterales bacterium]|jgi:hypothetical protein